MSPVCHPRKNNRKKPSYLTGDISQKLVVTKSSIHFFQEKNKNILYRKGFEYQPSLALSNPQFQRPYFLEGNVAGLAVTKNTLCRNSFPAALPPLEIYATDMPYAQKQNIAFWRGGAHPAPRCGSWTGVKRLGDLQVLDPYQCKNAAIHHIIPHYYIYYGLAIYK